MNQFTLDLLIVRRQIACEKDIGRKATRISGSPIGHPYHSYSNMNEIFNVLHKEGYVLRRDGADLLVGWWEPAKTGMAGWWQRQNIPMGS